MDSSEQTESEITDPTHDEFRIEEFLESNYRLFAILSVFGAISVYLPKIGDLDTDPVLRVGFVSTLFLILLTAVTIDRRFFSQVGRTKGLVQSLLHPSSNTYGLVLFIIPFNALTISLIGASGSYTATFIYLFQLIGTSIGIVITFHIIKTVDGWKSAKSEGDQNPLASIVVALFIGVLLMLFARAGMNSVKRVSGFTPEKMYTSTSQFGFLPVVDSVFFEIGLAGIIYWILALVLMIYGTITAIKIAYDEIISINGT